MLFPIFGSSSLPVAVAQPDERHANRTASVLVVWQTFGSNELDLLNRNLQYNKILKDCYVCIVQFPTVSCQLQGDTNYFL